MSDSTKPWLSVIGVGEDGADSLAPEAQSQIKSAQHLVGSPRLLALFPEVAGQERQAWPSPLAEIFFLSWTRGVVRQALCWRQVIRFAMALARLCYGGLRSKKLSSFLLFLLLRLPAHGFGWTSHTCETLTLHGRPLSNLLPHLYPRARLLILADSERTPHQVAQVLHEQGYGTSQITVLEHLGGKSERQITASV